MADINSGSFFEGEERLETFPVLGRKIRKGNLSALRISDFQRIRHALQEGKYDLARQYLEILKGNSEGMIVIYSEFIYAFAPILNAHSPLIDFKPVYARAYELFKKSLATHPGLNTGPETQKFLQIFHPDQIRRESVVELRAALQTGSVTSVAPLIEPTVAIYNSLSLAMDQGDSTSALAAFDQYFFKVRALHDSMVELDSLIISAIEELHGQEITEKVLYEAFTTCMFYEGLWSAMSQMSPVEVAAFLADHLRAHFAGPGSEGSVEWIEEKDRYRLRFMPCGSGGAMRQRAKRGISEGARPFPQATAQNWFRKNEVSGYCSHCAINEMESVRRMGYPLFYTEFNPDPDKPCGWTVFKDPAQIPDEYFKRIGQTRDRI